MGPKEVLYRIQHVLKTKLEILGIGLAVSPQMPAGLSGKRWLDVLPSDFERSNYIDSADRLIGGRFNVFSLKNVHLGFPPPWNVDPKTCTQAPLAFGKSINYRDEGLVGDIKYLWEINRHLELVTLAQAWHLTGECKYSEACRELLESWFSQCPYPFGVNWTCSLEHAVRLINWSYAWHLLGGEDSQLFTEESGKKFRARWLNGVFQHCHFIAGNFSRYSSANNHLLGEYMGLFVGAVTWPYWEQCAAWRENAKMGLEEEVRNQNFSDGVNREQAVWYHHEVADMMLHCFLIGRANGIEFSSEYRDRFIAMLGYIASIMDISGHVPMFGDSDDAVMVRFCQGFGFNAYRSLLATGAVLFDRAVFKLKAEQFDEKSRWLLGDAAAAKFDELQVDGENSTVRRSFPEGGYWILGDHLEMQHEARLVADAGHLGFLSIAAHGHADALSFAMSVGGHEILIDPGTFAYHTQKKWRDYFRGTSAHNTIRVDGLDQSVIGGNFLWMQHASAKCEKFEMRDEYEEWQASHDGYLRLDDPVRHHRTLRLNKTSNEIRVTDVLAGSGQHRVEIFWHFSENCNISRVQKCWCAQCGTSEAHFYMPAGFDVRAVRGAESPPLGWVSRKFDEKQPITTLVCSGNIKSGTAMTTLIRYKFIE